jgi:glycerate-2-kinase
MHIASAFFQQSLRKFILMQYRFHAETIYRAAVAAVQPAVLLQQFLSADENGIRINNEQLNIQTNSIIVIGAGKAAAAMAQSVETIPGNYIKAGFITTKYEHALPLQKINCIEAAHPVPDEQSILAVQQTIELLQQTTTGDVIICLLSGGASSLWADVPDGIALNELQLCFDLLLKSGANISEMNCVRRHLSSVKGGQLLRYAPNVRWFTLIISDVPGDTIQDIASGPTSADVTSFADAINIINKYHLQQQLPHSVLQHLQKGINGEIADTVKPGEALLNNVENIIIGSNKTCIAAAKQKAEELGYTVLVHDEMLTGDAADTAQMILQKVTQYHSIKPACLLFGGETTVTVTGKGKGGRNQHLALCALNQLTDSQNITLLAAGTDGTDGPTDAAGAFADNALRKTAERQQLSINDAIVNNDAYHFFEKVNGLLKTGATQTNVMDIVIVLIDE